MALVVVVPVEAVGKGEGAPFSTTPQAAAAEAEGREPWERRDHHILKNFGNRLSSWYELVGSRQIWRRSLDRRRCRFGHGYVRRTETMVFGTMD